MGCGACRGRAAVDAIDPNTAAGDAAGGKRSTAQVMSKKSRQNRPSLEELRELNQVLPGEAAGGAIEKNAFSGDKSGASCLEILEKNSVLVTVRVRPLNQRELDAGGGASARCLKFDGEAGLTLVRESNEKDYKFAFDCVLREEAEQQDVFDRTARPLLHKVLEGYNGCLFAYGQTGSGKTFTMQGGVSSELRGVIPRLCSELFHQIDARSANMNYTVQFSVLEIYNEHLRDLQSEDGEDLQIREDSEAVAAGGRGIHVDKLSELSVRSCDEVLALITKAQARRAVGKTNMNEYSSRSHLVVTLRITACENDDAEGVTLTSCKLHLVDLAGSERQKATGASGDRLKEGAQINLSLSALGNVINALTEPKRASGKGRHVPYRDSKLTRLLQDSLGGNAYTVIVNNVSPAQINADETLACLRFAERAKKVQNTATVNRDPRNERMFELIQENKALLAKVARLEAHIARLELHY